VIELSNRNQIEIEMSGAWPLKLTKIRKKHLDQSASAKCRKSEGRKREAGKLLDCVFTSYNLGPYDTLRCEHRKAAIVHFLVTHICGVHVQTQWIPEIAWLFARILLPHKNLHDKNGSQQDCPTQLRRPICVNGTDTSWAFFKSWKPDVMLCDSTNTRQHCNSTMLELCLPQSIELALIRCELERIKKTQRCDSPNF